MATVAAPSPAAPATPVGRPAGAPPAPPKRMGGVWIAGAVLALSNFMVVLDISIANVSVPHIAGALAISPDEGTWVITSYAVAEAICVPLTGWLAGRFGSVRTFLFAMTGFAVFSVLCGLSVSLPMLLLCRLGQGFCGGPIMPLTQTLLMRVFPPEKRGPAMGLWSMTTVTAPIAGPLIGGVISDNWSWHWIFFINIPVAIVCVVGSYMLIRDKETETRRAPIDLPGLGLLVVWVGAFQIMLDLGRDRDWFHSPLIVTLAIVAAIGLAVFLIWELTDDHPIVDLKIFRHRGFSFSVVAMMLTFGTYFANVVVTPQWLQGVIGYTATWSGMVTGWQGLLAVVLSPFVGRLVARYDPRKLFTMGVLWMAFCMYLRSRWTSGIDYWGLVLPHVLTGAGMAFFFIPIMTIMLGSVDPAETPAAAGMSSFLRTLSVGMGTSIATTMWANGAQRARADLTNIVQPGNLGAQAIEAHGFSAPQTRGILDQLVNGEAYVLSLDHLYQVAAVLMIVSGTIIWAAPRPGGKVDTSKAH